MIGGAYLQHIDEINFLFVRLFTTKTDKETLHWSLFYSLLIEFLLWTAASSITRPIVSWFLQISNSEKFNKPSSANILKDLSHLNIDGPGN